MLPSRLVRFHWFNHNPNGTIGSTTKRMKSLIASRVSFVPSPSVHRKAAFSIKGGSRLGVGNGGFHSPRRGLHSSNQSWAIQEAHFPEDKRTGSGGVFLLGFLRAFGLSRPCSRFRHLGA